MVIILKFENEEKYKILKMAQNHNENCRYSDLVTGKNLDNAIFRTKLNRKIIEKLIYDGFWKRSKVALSAIPNQQHDWIVECLSANKIEIYFVEVEKDIYR